MLTYPSSPNPEREWGTGKLSYSHRVETWEMAVCTYPLPPILSARLPSEGDWTAHRALEALGNPHRVISAPGAAPFQAWLHPWFSPHIYPPNLPRSISVPMEPHHLPPALEWALALHSILASLSCCLLPAGTRQAFFFVFLSGLWSLMG